MEYCGDEKASLDAKRPSDGTREWEVAGSISEILRFRASNEGAGIAYGLIEREQLVQQTTYAELDRRACFLATVLSERFKRGDRALLLYGCELEFMAAFFGCLYAGVIAVPVYPPDPARLNRTLPRLSGVVARSGACVVLSSKMFEPLRSSRVFESVGVSELDWIVTDSVGNSGEGGDFPVEVAPRDPAFLQYTSGSLGDPKGVVVTHENLLCNERMLIHATGVDRSSVCVNWVPFYHDMGLIGALLLPMVAGFPSFVMSPYEFLKSPLTWLSCISRFRGTIATSPPFGYDLCLQQLHSRSGPQLDLSSWEIAVVGAERIRARSLARFAEGFAPSGFRSTSFLPAYGLAEATLIVSGRHGNSSPSVETFSRSALEAGRALPIASTEEDGVTLVGCGPAILDEEIIIVDPERRVRLPSGEVGEIWVQGSNVAAGYWKDAEATSATFEQKLADVEAGSYLRTGDLGFEWYGELFVAGRLKELMILRGRNHHPADIEMTVEASHEAIRRGCCIAFSVDREHGESLVIVAELSQARPEHRGEILEQEVRFEEIAQAIRRCVSECHGVRVEGIVFLPPRTVPKTSSGKVQRLPCRAAYDSRSLEAIWSWEGSAANSSHTLQDPS